MRALIAFALLACSLRTIIACSARTMRTIEDAPPTWRVSDPLPGPRFEAFAATVEGRIVYVGGITGIPGNQLSARESNRVDVYDPRTRRWTSGPALPVESAKHHLAAAVLADRLYVLGGFTGIIGGADVAGRFLPNRSTFVLEGATFRRLADAPLARGGATAQAIDGKLYVVGGGADERGAYSDLAIYDPALDLWRSGTPMKTPREHLASCAIDGRMIVIGGWAGDDKTTVAAAESYDPRSDMWTALPDMPTSRGGMNAAVVNGACHVIGGERWDRGLPGTFSAVERFDPATRAWTRLPNMPTARHGIGVTALNGQIYVVGGGPIMGNSYTDVVEVLEVDTP